MRGYGEGADKNGNDKDQEIQAMVQRSVFSLSWSIADVRCYMVILQALVITAAIFNLLLIYESLNGEVEAEFECSAKDFNAYNGPYVGEATADTIEEYFFELDLANLTNITDIESGAAFPEIGDIYYCSWPDINIYVRAIPAFVGLVSGLITITLSYCLGKKMLFDIDNFNDTRQAGQKLEYFDVYSGCGFVYMRKLIGLMGYAQFVSVGMDLNSYFAGKETLDRLKLKESSELDFLLPIWIGIAIAFLLRLSHDSMFQRTYKRKIPSLNIKLTGGDKVYAGPTISEHETRKSIGNGL